MKNRKLPKEVLIYQCDEANGEPIYGVATTVDDIPADADGQTVGVYTLNHESTFHIRRQLK